MVDGTGLIAVLPMYDWPEVRGDTDRLWQSLNAALADAGVASPARLNRNVAPEAAWTSPQLVLGQTCGLPYVQTLADRVALVGTPAYALEGLEAGWYCSVLVVRAGEEAGDLAALRGRRVAYNGPGSQSGDAALRHLVAPLAAGGRFFAEAVKTGSHRASLRAVAAGTADIAAIDAVSFALARRHEPAVETLRVLGLTPPTPGLPFITAMRPDEEVARISAAVSAGIDALDAAARDRLLLTGFVRTSRRDYDVIAERAEAATALGYAAFP